jgi:hypothetical protein
LKKQCYNQDDTNDDANKSEFLNKTDINEDDDDDGFSDEE